MRLPWCLTLLALLAAGCGSSGVKGDDFGAAPRGFRGFPPQTIEGIVYAQARFVDHAHALGIDLIDEESVVPIQLKVQLRGEGQETAQIYLNPDRMNLRLYLPDGAVLSAVPADEVAAHLASKTAQHIRDAAFRGDLLGTEGLEGFVFFRLRPESEFQVRDRIVRHTQNGVVRSMDLADALISFDLSVAGGGDVLQPFYVGVQR